MEALVLDNNSTHSKTDWITRTIRALTKHEEELAANKKTRSIHSKKTVSRLRHSITILSPVTHPLSLSDQLAGILLRQKEHSLIRISINSSNSWTILTIRTSAIKITIRILSMIKIQNQSTSSRWKTPLVAEILLKKMVLRSGKFVKVRILTKTSYIQIRDSSKVTH
jgi:hypothetical protein